MTANNPSTLAALAAIRQALTQLESALKSGGPDPVLTRLSPAVVQLDKELTRSEVIAGQPSKPSPTPPSVPPSPPVPVTPPPTVTPSWSIPLSVLDTAGVQRTGELCSCGVPLSYDKSVTDARRLVVVDDTGKYLPTDVRPTAWWRKTPTDKTIQWVQVTFDCGTIQPSTKRTYRLVPVAPGNPNPPSTSLLNVDLVPGNKDLVIIDTGAASFTISGTGLFLAIQSGSYINALVPTTTFNNSTKLLLRSVDIEYQGLLVLILTAEFTFTDLPLSILPNGPVSLRRRYTFHAGSSLVCIGERICYEGSLVNNPAPPPTVNGQPNAILGTQWKETLHLPGRTSVSVLSESDKPPSTTTNTGVVQLRQDLRDRRLESITLNPEGNPKSAIPRALSYHLTMATTPTQGVEATGGLIATTTPNGQTFVAALDHMHRYESQSLAILPDGTLEISLASDKFWLSHHQAIHVNLLVGLLPDNSESSLRAAWARLNHPLRCLPDAATLSQAHAFLNPVPVTPNLPFPVLPSTVTGHDKVLSDLCLNTMRSIIQEGIQGLTTFGSFPRYWGDSWPSPELGDGLKGGWDSAYLHATWTDYWCTSYAAIEWAIRSSDPVWLDELAFPAAQRMLHTQIMQGGPSDTSFYIGQSPWGYGAFRTDFNSSHQYWSTLYAYYLLTGDRQVIDLIERGAQSQVTFMRNGGSVQGRQPNQWIECYRFLSHTSPNSDWGSIFEEMVTRALDTNLITGTYPPTLLGKLYAFWSTGKPPDDTDPNSKTPGTVETEQLFSMGYYDMENLYHLGLRNGNAPVGKSAVRPWDVLVSLARTVCTLGLLLPPGADGTVSGPWVRCFDVTLDSTGTLTSVKPGTVSNESLLYPDDKPALCAFIARAAAISKDPLLVKCSHDLIDLAFKRGQSGHPMGKLMGLITGRLGPAVAIEAGEDKP